MQHDPDMVLFVEADLDEVIASTQGSQVLNVRTTIEARVFLDQLSIARFQNRPSFLLRRGWIPPCSPLVSPRSIE